MSLQINEVAPDFEAETTEGRIRFHDWIGNSWAVLFSHPKNFTPVCTTELGYMARIKSEFDKRGVKIIGPEQALAPALAPHAQQLDDRTKVLTGRRQPVEMAFAAGFRLDMDDAGLLKLLETLSRHCPRYRGCGPE